MPEEISPNVPNAPVSPAPTANQTAIAELNKPESDLWSKDEAKQQAAYAKLREYLALESTPEELDTLANEPIETLRSRYGIPDPKDTIPNPALRERWNAEAEAAGRIRPGGSPGASAWTPEGNGTRTLSCPGVGTCG